MNFDFSEDQYLLRDSLRGFLADNWGTSRLRAAQGQFDATLWQGLCGLGLQTLLIPEEYGGAGLGLVDAVLAFEEFGRALVPGPMVDTILASEVIARFGAEALKAEWLPEITTGAARIAFAHAEPMVGQAPDVVHLKAQPTAQGWRLDGRKILVPAADAVTGLAVSARLPDGGTGLFLCRPATTGVSIARNVAIDPDALACRVDFADAPAVLLGAGALPRLLAISAIAASAQMVGIAGAALDMAVAYAKVRSQFGAQIGSFQAIKHKCADMLMAVDTSSAAAYYAAWAATEEDAGMELAVSVAKAASGDACRRVCNDCLQIHGGVGYTWEFDVHLFMKRGKLLEYSFGDASWHREPLSEGYPADSGMSPMLAADQPVFKVELYHVGCVGAVGESGRADGEGP